MTLAEALADARRTFPDFPDAIFTLWLDDRIKSNGWPPQGFEWQGFLSGRSLDFWKSLKWHEEEVTLSPDQLRDNSFQIAVQIIEAATGVGNLMAAYIPNTVERFKSCLSYAVENRTLPGRPLFLRGPDGIEVIDGNHRIAALLALQSRVEDDALPLRFNAWIATSPSDGA